MYQHLVATLAMTEAYGMTQSVLFKDAAQRAVNFVHQCQNPYAGWGPGVRDGTNDTILTAWAVLCLRSAQIAELDVDRSAFVGAMTWTASMTDPATGAVGATVRGVAPPLPAPGEAKFPPATAASLDAAGAVIRIQCLAGLAKPGERPDLAADPFVVRAAERLRAAPPRWDEAAGTIDAQAWFLGSSAAWQIGGDTWKTWSDALRRAVVDAQCTETGRDERGSWAPHGPYAKEGGRIYSTTLLTLCMETFYRYARVVGVR
jgi:hypothetical protein